MAPVPAPNMRRIAYIIRLDVEFLQEGHAEHKQDAAVEVQQQASYKLKKKITSW